MGSVEAEPGKDGDPPGAGHYCPAHQPLDATHEEQAAILAMLSKRAECPPASGGPGGATAWARAAFKVAAIVMVIAGVGKCLGDGGEFDDGGCGVAQKPPGSSRSAHSSHARAGASGKVPGSDGGPVGGSADGGPDDPPNRHGRPSICAHRMPGRQCQITKLQCPLLAEVDPLPPTHLPLHGGEGRGEGGTAVAVALRNGSRPPGLRQDFLLRKGHRAWTLVFDGRETVLPDEKGVAYVAVLLLDPPREPIHGAELANRAFGDAVVAGQSNPGIDDRDTIRALGDARRKCQAVLDDPTATQPELDEARAELDAIDAWARKHMRGTAGNEQRQVRAVRQAIRRLLTGLANARDAHGEPNHVLRSFAAHLEQHLWRPSARGSQGRNLRLRAGLAGRFTYEPPEGVEWTE